MGGNPCRELIGSLIYLANTTRPDIAYAANSLSTFANNPGKVHWNTAKRVLRYLKGRNDFKITYQQSKEMIVGYSDSDWANDPEDRRSCSGYIVKLAGGPVCWRSRYQKCTALSTMEAEYIALSEVTKEIVYLRKLLNEIGLGEYCEKPTPVYCDNQSAIRVSKDSLHHERSKHIDIKYHFCREKQSEGIIDVSYIPTSEMMADVLTKGLDRVKQENCIKLILN